jgi:hypothetical protein
VKVVVVAGVVPLWVRITVPFAAVVTVVFVEEDESDPNGLRTRTAIEAAMTVMHTIIATSVFTRTPFRVDAHSSRLRIPAPDAPYRAGGTIMPALGIGTAPGDSGRHFG